MARGRPSKKSHIIDTALTLFSRLGYQGTSIDQVVVAAEVSKPTVYSNFSSKQILWHQALERILENTEKDLQAFDKKEKSAIDLWLSLWQVWLDDANRLAVYRIMLGESHKMEESSFTLFKQLEAQLDKALDKVLLGLEKPLNLSQRYILIATSKDALLMPNLYKNQALTLETRQPVVNLSPERKALLASLLCQDEAQ